MPSALKQWHDVFPNLVGGEAENFEYSLTAVKLIGGAEIQIAPSGVTAIVGGNNVGKSTVLRGIRDHIRHHSQYGIATSGVQLVEQVRVNRRGNALDAVAWVAQRAPYTEHEGSQGFAVGDGYSLAFPRAIHGDWIAGDEGGGGSLGESLAPFVIYFADAQERLNFSHQVAQRDDIGDPPSHPLHHLQDDPALLAKVNEYCQDVFRATVTLDRLSHKSNLRLGAPGVPAPAVDAVTPEYREALMKLPSLATQGDGMRSFFSLLLPLITRSSQVVIIDEPEAFLHPPQAFALGRAVAELAQEKQLQVILATHDRNFLAGLLDPQEVDVSVVRLSRERDENPGVHQLRSEPLRSIWQDSVLRYTNVLDGLFHQIVVLCEGDRDCRFFAATLDGLSGSSTIPSAEVLFLPTSGKDGMVRLVETLSQVRVPVICSPDLDVLDDENKLRTLVTAMSGDWDSLSQDYKLATKDFVKPPSQATCADVLSAIDGVLRPLSSKPYDGEVKRRILAQTRTDESPWRALKKYGLRAFVGDSAPAAVRLLETLQTFGIVPVREGELERLAPSLGVSKKEWLSAALQAGAHLEASAREHVRRVLAAASAVNGGVVPRGH